MSASRSAPHVLILVMVLLTSVSLADDVDVSYGKASQQTLDVYTAENNQENGTRPVVVWVHGGGWRNGDKDNRSGKNLCKAWAQAGVVMVNLNYRLTPDVMHPAHVEDVAAGISWVHKNIATHGGDPKKIFLLGHSAGAHLVALVATNPKFLKVHDLTPKKLAGVMPIDTASYELAENRALLVRKMIRDAFGDKPEVLAEASPLVQAKKHREACPPFVIAVTKQRPDAWKESIAFKDALANSKLIVMDYPGSGQLKAHAEIARDLIDVDNDMTKQLLTFVRESNTK